jgi:hypothetical protein
VWKATVLSANFTPDTQESPQTTPAAGLAAICVVACAAARSWFDFACWAIAADVTGTDCCVPSALVTILYPFAAATWASYPFTTIDE